MKNKRKERGKFITFEGTEGSGKSTQIQLSIEFLQSKGFSVVFTHEPGGTRIGERIRDILLKKEYKEMDDYCETFLFFASRAQLIKEVINPALSEGKIVLCDRFLDATICYQGYGNGIDIEFIHQMSRFIDIKPDLTILLDIEPEEGLKRLREKDRIEERDLGYYQRVRRGYLELAKREPRRIKVIKVEGVEKTRERIEETLREFLLLPREDEKGDREV